MRGGGSAGINSGGGGGFDPSNLHLRKELTQIKKAARALRDPGTTSSWRSPLGSARTAAAAMQVSDFPKQHYYHNHNKSFHEYKDYNNHNSVPRKQFSRNSMDNNHTRANNDSNISGNANAKTREEETRVYLHNWKMQRSESEKSRRRDDPANGDVDGSLSTPEESVQDSLSDARNGGNDSRSDTYVGENHSSMNFKFKDTTSTTSIRQRVKRRSQKQMEFTEGSKRALKNLPGLGLEKDDLTSCLVDQSDDTEDYCNLEELKNGSLTSPLLARIKNRNWGRSSAKLSRDSKKKDPSYTYSTPAWSTSSFKRYYLTNPSTIDSWDATTASLTDIDAEADDPLDFPGRQGCGIPCYWSRRSTPKSRGGYGCCYSPSLSDTLRRKGCSILCGRHSMIKKRRGGSSLSYGNRNITSRIAGQGVIPLLTNSANGQGGSSLGSRNSDDELSTNFGELDLEALSRLDGRRWSTSGRSQEGLQLVAFNGEAEEGTPENGRSLSYKYRPMFFEELIGQNIVVQSLINAVSRGRIAPVYLFQGPRGTGKTSTARIFAAALNCLASEETKPCGICRECAEFASGKSKNIREVDGASKKSIDRMKYHLKKILMAPSSAFLRYQVFVVDECHLLPAKTLLAFLKFIQEPPPRVVFLLITNDLDNLPRTVLSRCQKYNFNKIRDSDIVTRLRKIATEENLDVESDALEVIALNADGSLGDAETMLEQLSLFGKKITTSLVNELVGVVSDEKLLELLKLALSSDTAKTVTSARELLDSGVDPIVLMSQLASLIMDIIAGTCPNVGATQNGSFFREGNLNDMEFKRLKHALKLLSEAEKQLRVSSERSKWFTATLLQLGPLPTPDRTHSSSSQRQSSRATEEDPCCMSREALALKQRPDGPRMSESSTSFSQATLNQSIDGKKNSTPQADSVDEKNPSTDFQILENIWVRCIEKCHSKTLRQLLHTYGKLVSISKVEGVYVAYIAFMDSDIKIRAERFHSSITNAFELVMRSNVEVRIVFLPDGWTSLNSANVYESPLSLSKQMESTNYMNWEGMLICSKLDVNSEFYSHKEPLKVSRGSFSNSEVKLPGIIESTDGHASMSGSKDRKSKIPVQRIESIIHEQRLETAWLQAMGKGTPGSLSRLKPERNQILPQDVECHHNQMESMNSLDLPHQHREEELNREIKSLKITGGKGCPDDQICKRDHLPLSPSLLHDTKFAGHISKESSMGYESEAGAGGCSGLFCWKNHKPRKRVKVKKGSPLRSHKSGRLLWFGVCAKPRWSGKRRR